MYFNVAMRKPQGMELTYYQLHKYCNKRVCAVFESLYVYVCLQHRLTSASVSDHTDSRIRVFLCGMYLKLNLPAAQLVFMSHFGNPMYISQSKPHAML